MSLHRFYLPPEQWAHDLWLEGQEAKHLVQVLRLAPGEEVLLLDGQGRSGRFAIAETAKKKARLVLQEEQMAPAGIPRRHGAGLQQGRAPRFLYGKGRGAGCPCRLALAG